jgi:hypothetical protein
MIKMKRMGVNMSDNIVSFSVTLVIAMQHKVKGAIVLMICQVAILSSLLMYGLMFKSIRLSGVVDRVLVAALVKGIAFVD